MVEQAVAPAHRDDAPRRRSEEPQPPRSRVRQAFEYPRDRVPGPAPPLLAVRDQARRGQTPAAPLLRVPLEPEAVVGERGRREESLLRGEQHRHALLPASECVPWHSRLFEDAAADRAAVIRAGVPGGELARAADRADRRRLSGAGERQWAVQEAGPEAVLGERQARLVSPNEVRVGAGCAIPHPVAVEAREQHAPGQVAPLLGTLEAHVLAL